MDECQNVIELNVLDSNSLSVDDATDNNMVNNNNKME